MRSIRCKGPRSAFTFIELLVSLALLALVMQAAYDLARGGSKLFEATRLRNRMDTAAQRSGARVVAGLEGAIAESLDPPLEDGESTSDLRFRHVLGLVGTAVQWGPLTRLAFEYAEGELDDGADNNGDGLVDEGVLVFTRDMGGAEEKRVVICHDLAEYLAGEVFNGFDDNGNEMDDEQGFVIELRDGALIARLTIQAIEDGRVIEETVETTITLRN